jgi:hypothetical protein
MLLTLLNFGRSRQWDCMHPSHTLESDEVLGPENNILLLFIAFFVLEFVF